MTETTLTYLDGSRVRPIIIYISGPMTGLPEFNAPAFAAYTAKYRAQGFQVISPAELDGDDHGQPYRHYLRRDMNVLLDEHVERIYMMPGWERSRGAKLERHAAEAVGIEVYDAETGEKMENFYV